MRFLARCAGLATLVVLLGPAATPAEAQTITCNSTNNSYQYCPINTHGRVFLAHQESSTDCIEGRTWGFDSRGIWVDNGCRARFGVGNASSREWHGSSGNYGNRVDCASRDGRYNHCNVETGGYVRLVRQISNTRCVSGQNWGFDRHGIWVSGGCRAEFEVQGSGRGYQHFQTYTNDRGHYVRCESQDGHYARCRVHVSGGVKVANNISSTRCELSKNWGFDSNGIWVNDGCRAEFVIGEGYTDSNRSPWGQYQSRGSDTIVCESQDDKRSTCGVRNAWSARMVRQLSNSACVEGVSWGKLSDAVWVSRGCRAEFSVQ